MQTSSTVLLLVNFLAASVTAGVGALGTPHSGASLEPLLPINHADQEAHILSASRGSGRINTDQPGIETIAWRGSGRTQTDPDDNNHQADASLAWRGSGRAQPNSDNGVSNEIGFQLDGRGSGRIA